MGDRRARLERQTHEQSCQSPAIDGLCKIGRTSDGVRTMRARYRRIAPCRLAHGWHTQWFSVASRESLLARGGRGACFERAIRSAAREPLDRLFLGSPLIGPGARPGSPASHESAGCPDSPDTPDRPLPRAGGGGPGVPSDQLRIFEAFRRLRESPGGRQSGAGLGLTIARGFVEAHRGDVRVETTSGGGATFVVSLPIS
jgi:hypothetical protein